MNDNDIEILSDNYGNKYCVMKNVRLTYNNIREIIEVDNKWYFENKLLHRDDGPAIENPNGNKHWYKNGKRHREDGPAIEWHNGDKEWYKNGVLHRDDSPAVEYNNGTNFWCQYGKYHREDGPAIEYKDETKDYYVNGIKISEENFYLEKELRESIINNNKSKKNKI